VGFYVTLDFGLKMGVGFEKKSKNDKKTQKKSRKDEKTNKKLKN